MNMPGFTAEMSLRKTHEQYQLIANEANQTSKGTVVPQYCQCECKGTPQLDETGQFHWGPPYHCYCWGSDCWHPKFGH
jgi:hypothetical protein